MMNFSNRIAAGVTGAVLLSLVIGNPGFAVKPVRPPSNCVAARDEGTPGLDVVVTWNDNSEHESGFRIARSTDKSNWENVGIVTPNVTCFRDTGNLTAGCRYYYKVRAFINCHGGPAYSEFSNIEAAIPR